MTKCCCDQMWNWSNQHRKLLAHIDELKTRGGADEQECSCLRQKALDIVNLAGLWENPVYRDIESLPLDENFLSNLRGRLELALQLAKTFQRRRRRGRPGRRFPSPGAGSKARAKSVALFFGELRIVVPLLTNGRAYQEVRQTHRHLKIFEVLETRPKLQVTLLAQSESSRHLLTCAQLFAAHYHGKELSTIKSDWKNHKGRQFRRKRPAGIIERRPATKTS